MKKTFFNTSKKWISALALGLLWIPGVDIFAQISSGLRTGNSIVVDQAKIESTNVLTDPKGLVYIEVVEGTYVLIRDTELRFTGEILPPSIIDEEFYNRNPRNRVREIVSFELASDTLESLWFVEKLWVSHPKIRERAAIIAPESLVNSRVAKVIIPLFNDYGHPALWEFVGTDENGKEEWVRMGGRVEETREDDVDLFIATLNGTGVFVLFDEDPAPDEQDMFIPYEEIQKAPEAPYTSVQPKFDPPPIVEDIFDPTFDPNNPNQVNFPVDDPFDPTFQSNNQEFVVQPVRPLSGDVNLGADLTPEEDERLGVFGVPEDRLGIPGNFRGRDITAGGTPQGVSTAESALLGGTDDQFVQQALLEDQDRPGRVEDLINARLFGSDGTGAPINFEEPSETDTTPQENQTISSVLLRPSEGENTTITRATDVTSALLSSAPEEDLSELMIQENPEVTIPDGNLPKTGNTAKSFWTFAGILIFLAGAGTLIWRRRSPKQMTIKMK